MYIAKNLLAASNVIAVSILEDRIGLIRPFPFPSPSNTGPSKDLAPIYKIVECRSKRIKEFYWKLWFGDRQILPSIGIRNIFVGPKVTIDSMHRKLSAAFL